MPFSSMPAFAGSPLIPGVSRSRYTHFAVTPRRSRRCPVSARSLDSYREGNRFGDDDSARRSRSRRSSSSQDSIGISGKNESEKNESGRRESGKGETHPPRAKLRVPLVNALSKLNVASLETCAFLVRSGCVRVNGDVVSDQKAKIHRFDDELVVNGKSYGILGDGSHNDDASESSDGDTADVADPELLTRRQRDFRKSPRQNEGPEKFKKYNRRVDRGFFSSRRYHGGK